MCDYIFQGFGNKFLCRFTSFGNDFYVKEIIGYYNTLLIDIDEYILINGFKIKSRKKFFTSKDFYKWFKNKLLVLGIILEQEDNLLKFTSIRPFNISLGSYYFNKILNLNNSLESIYTDNLYSIIIPQYRVNMWFLVSSIGTPTIISNEENEKYIFLLYKGLVDLKENEPFNISNTDTSTTKILNNIIEMNLVDENFYPIRLISKTYLLIKTRNTEELKLFNNELTHSVSRTIRNQRLIKNKFQDHLNEEDEKIFLNRIPYHEERKGLMIFPHESSFIPMLNETNEIQTNETNTLITYDTNEEKEENEVFRNDNYPVQENNPPTNPDEKNPE
jgi:hypothetical protein